MKIAIMQPYLFPHIGYFQLIQSVDKFILLDDVNYIKGGWINRNYILIANNPGLFTLELRNSSSNKRINEIEVNISPKWKKKFLKTLIQNYRKSPFFTSVFPLINNITDSKLKKISELNYYSISLLNEYIGINTILENSSEKYDNTHLKGQERVIDICQQEGANVYINSIGGKGLYNSKYFESNGIDLRFLEHCTAQYSQFEKEFIPGLSIIDVLMFNSPQKIKNHFLLDYKLIE